MKRRDRDRDGLGRLFAETRPAACAAKSRCHWLRKSRERLILLEGEPGAGKSVALRHLTEHLARCGPQPLASQPAAGLRQSEGTETEGQPKGRQTTHRAFCPRIIAAAWGSRCRRLCGGRIRGRPEERHMAVPVRLVRRTAGGARSTDADQVILQYADAIRDFLHGMNTCRGILASRQFRGPGHLTWPKFRIVSLTRQRGSQLVKRFRLGPRPNQNYSGGLIPAARTSPGWPATPCS